MGKHVWFKTFIGLFVCLFVCVTGGGVVQAEQPGEAWLDTVLQNGRWGGHRHLCQPGRDRCSRSLVLLTLIGEKIVLTHLTVFFLGFHGNCFFPSHNYLLQNRHLLRRLLKDGMKSRLNPRLYTLILTQGASRTELGRKEREMFASQISSLNEPRMAKEEVRFEMWFPSCRSHSSSFNVF